MELQQLRLGPPPDRDLVSAWALAAVFVAGLVVGVLLRRHPAQRFGVRLPPAVRDQLASEPPAVAQLGPYRAPAVRLGPADPSGVDGARLAAVLRGDAVCSTCGIGSRRTAPAFPRCPGCGRRPSPPLVRVPAPATRTSRR